MNCYGHTLLKWFNLGLGDGLTNEPKREIKDRVLSMFYNEGYNDAFNQINDEIPNFKSIWNELKKINKHNKLKTYKLYKILNSLKKEKLITF